MSAIQQTPNAEAAGRFIASAKRQNFPAEVVDALFHRFHDVEAVHEFFDPVQLFSRYGFKGKAEIMMGAVGDSVTDDPARFVGTGPHHGWIEKLLFDAGVDLQLFLEGAEALALLVGPGREVVGEERPEALMGLSEELRSLHLGRTSQSHASLTKTTPKPYYCQ